MSSNAKGVAVLLVLVMAGGGVFLAKRLSETTLGDIPLEARQLPGIELSLPGGDMRGDHSEYIRGEVMIVRNDKPVVVTVLGWEPGDPLTGEELAAMMSGMAEGTLVEDDRWEAAIGEHQVSGVYLTGGQANILFTTFPCGNRSLFFGTISDSGKDDHRALHERIIATVKCTDQEINETHVVAPVFTPPAGYGYVPGDPTEGVNFEGLDGGGFSFFEGGGANVMRYKDQFASAMESGMKLEFDELSISDEYTELAGPDGSPRVMWTVDIVDDGEAAHGFLVLWRCPGLDLNLGGMFVGAAGQAAEQGKQALLAAACPAADDNPIAAYPLRDAVFEAACAAGDQRGCTDE